MAHCLSAGAKHRLLITGRAHVFKWSKSAGCQSQVPGSRRREHLKEGPLATARFNVWHYCVGFVWSGLPLSKNNSRSLPPFAPENFQKKNCCPPLPIYSPLTYFMTSLLWPRATRSSISHRRLYGSTPTLLSLCIFENSNNWSHYSCCRIVVSFTIFYHRINN